MSGLSDYRKFVADASASSYFGNWKKQNPGEYSRWLAFDKAVQAGPADPIVLKTKFGQSLVDAAVIYLNAYESPVVTPPPVEPPVVEPPPVVTPPTTSGPFQALWDATRPPQRSWLSPVTITSQQALTSWLSSRPANGHAIVKGFTFNGRLEIRGGPVWLECDPTFQVVNRGIGSNYIGIWLVQTSGCFITGYPVAHDCGNQGLRAQAAVDCYLEVETRDNGGNGVLLDQVGGTGTKTSGTFKIKGGGNGRAAMPPGSPGYEAAFYAPDIDPHAQKGTGAHHANIWRLDAGTTLLVDIDKEQRYGAGCQTTGLQGTSSKPIVLAIRAVNLSCDVNAIPPAPGGGRQEAGNAWQGWGDAHSFVSVKAVECGKATRGVYNTGSYASCTVAYGRVQAPRLSPCWSGAGVTMQDVSPRP
jgi:hypothetical protein